MAHFAPAEIHATITTLQQHFNPSDIEVVEASHGLQSEICDQDARTLNGSVKETGNPFSRTPRGPMLVDQDSDVASTHSIPAIVMTDPTPVPPQGIQRNVLPDAQPLTGINTQRPASSRTHIADEGTITHEPRGLRHRSAVEIRSSNRLSGFFNSLMYRRDNLSTANARDTFSEGSANSAAASNPAKPPSRSSSLQPVRSLDLPPQLPAPTLQELGLSLSVLTTALSPSHFTTPPTSGAFLPPHHLLLCHAQGLDVLPLMSPLAQQPYALVRRVSFKSVVVMEQRGVLVAIAGRRDGVRVYALEEVKKAIDWRIEYEVKRERELMRREAIKKGGAPGLGHQDVIRHPRKPSLSTPPPVDAGTHRNIFQKRSRNDMRKPSSHPPVPPIPLIPREPTQRTPGKQAKSSSTLVSAQRVGPTDSPPPYVGPSDISRPSRLRNQLSARSFRSRGAMLDHVLISAATRHNPQTSEREGESKPDVDWIQSSDEEAIDIVAAGASGSQALDERTSVTFSTSGATPEIGAVPVVTSQISHPAVRRPSSNSARNRPSSLDLPQSMVNGNSAVPTTEPSPTHTLLDLRQALSINSASQSYADPDPGPLASTTIDEADDDDDEEVDGRISLAQALLESRLPNIPPLGTSQPQKPILFSVSPNDNSTNPRSSDSINSIERQSHSSSRRRRRWSMMIRNQALLSDAPSSHIPSPTAPASVSACSGGVPLRRRPSFLFNDTLSAELRPTTSNDVVMPRGSLTPPNSLTTNFGCSDPSSVLNMTRSSRSTRFISRFIGNAFHRSDERPLWPTATSDDLEGLGRLSGNHSIPQTPPPKLEYVKLPGTKNATSIKAVETVKKSFLAILCGENGEKVELFAGTYRTALGLSRTFILPDSPRSLELQLQGDDLVEVFLVFSQNVFGLEPATVRVREVRIGRAERRAARRRARGTRSGDMSSAEQQDDDTNVTVSIGMSVTVVSSTGHGPDSMNTPSLIPGEHPDTNWDQLSAPTEQGPPINTSQVEEIVALVTAEMGPYTTFQQLSFSPNFPLASIAEEYIIPPTYAKYLEHRANHEPHNSTSMSDVSQSQFSPPGLPVPSPAAPSKWYYRDPKNNIHGPWKASLMQSWYKDGLLPPNLPVRREEEHAYVLLKDLRLQCIDPTQPFHSPPPSTFTAVPVSTVHHPKDSDGNPLLSPVSLLAQPRDFGPPALFFSSRGGHSTSIVDSRGRSVLKGRFFWSNDDKPDDSKHLHHVKMGDIKHLETFDVNDRSVLVAMRQGGLEALDVADALLRPADESRTTLPFFNASPSQINRRAPFVWKIGTPITSSTTELDPLPYKHRNIEHIPTKRNGINTTKTPVGRDDGLGDMDSDFQDEVLFLGRKDDEIYICEKNSDSFRILRLSPNASS